VFRAATVIQLNDKFVVKLYLAVKLYSH